VVQTLLGIVERFAQGKSGPGARLRPLFQASQDKSRWIAPEEEFPNSGVVSWWQPLPDAELYKAWTFHIERSWTYDIANEHHDFFGVKGSPTPAIELFDLPAADDPEDVRALLLEEGIPLERCASKRFVFRDRSGSVVGPLELVLRDGRLFLEEKETHVPLSRGNVDLVLGEWQGHAFLPLENGLHKTGEVDFSPNPVFLRRVLREIRDMPQTVTESAKLTERLISSYSSALEKLSLSPLQAQRLKRLHKLAEKASAGITLGEDAVPDLLALQAVQNLISGAKEQAVQNAIEERRAALSQLDKQKTGLEEEVGNLQKEAGRLRDEIASSKNEQSELLSSFDSRIQNKFQEIGKNATSFLSDVALIRAALSTPVSPAPSASHPEPRPDLPRAQPLDAAQLMNTFRGRFETAGLGCILPTALLSSWASGYVPMLFGVMARDALLAAGESLFGGSVHFATLGPTLSSPEDLLGLPTASRFAVSTVGDLVGVSSRSGDLVLLVFENTNLCQLDSTLVPLLRSYADFHGDPPTSSSSVQYPTPAGMWPSNVLLAGILIDSPLALPLSGELWMCGTFIDASSKRACLRGGVNESRIPRPVLQLPYEEWVRWIQTIEHGDASDTRVLASHIAREVESSLLFKRMLRRLAAAIDQTATPTSEPKRAGILVEMAVVPYLLSRGVPPHTIFDDAPAEISTDDPFIDTMTKLFEKWGLEANRESQSGS
jgi:hypothetical protein